ncbi:MAG: tripartite tricarboxylate transporter TctB family protein [Treponemataceae bacterium]
MSRNKDILTGSVSIALGLILFFLSFQVKDFASVSVGPEFLPRIAAVLFVVLGGVLSYQGLKATRLARTTVAASPVVKKDAAEAKYHGGMLPVAYSLLVMGVYIALLKPVGFIITSALFIFFQIIILSKGLKRNYFLFVVVSALSSVIAYYLFVRVFQVMIPAGILG